MWKDGCGDYTETGGGGLKENLCMTGWRQGKESGGAAKANRRSSELGSSLHC